MTEDEISEAIKKLPKKKASGPDQISNELIGTALLANKALWAKLFTDIIKTKEIPEQWKLSDIILLHKKGKKEDINNYRPISLSSRVYKVFANIIRNLIKNKLTSKQPVEQAGFRPTFSTIDHLHTINQLMEKSAEFNTPLYMAFIDFKKAFDSLKHECIWKALEEDEIDQNYIKVIKAIYNEAKAQIVLEKRGRRFAIKKGVRQGCPLSADLFNSVLENAFKKLITKWKNKGLIIHGKRLNNLRFADDIVLIATSAESLSEMIKDLSEVCKEVGLHISREKTKLITNRKQIQILLEEEPLEYVEEFVYLGQLISFEDRANKEIERRIKNTWKKFWALKKILKGKINLGLKGKVIEKCLLPVLLYGCQTWSLTKAQYKKLDTTQMQLLRSIAGIKKTDKVRNEIIRKRTGCNTLASTTARKLKWKWAGHVARTQDNRWTLTTTNWKPGNRKRRGRNRRRWADEIQEKAGVDWKRVAQDRVKWSELEPVIASTKL